MKKYLFLTMTHGDETIGVEVMGKIKKSDQFDWLIVNEQAYQQGCRFVERDMNRVAPGKIDSPIYEERRAAEVLKIAKNYQYIVDIHETTADSGVFIIITKPTIENFVLARKLKIKNVVIWVAKKQEVINPLSEYFDCGLEIECGPKNSLKNRKILKKTIDDLLRDGDVDINFRQDYYQVYGILNSTQDTKMSDFRKTKYVDEEFYPLLVGQYDGIASYKMRKIDFREIFSY